MPHSLRLFLLSARLHAARPVRPALTLTLGCSVVVSCGSPSSAPSLPAPGTVSAPNNFAVTASTASSISLGWTAVSGATGYVLERSEAGGAFHTLATPAASATSYVDSTVTPGTTYTYRLKVRAATGDSAYTPDLSAVPSAGGTDSDGDEVSDADEVAGYDVIIKDAGTTQRTYRTASNPASRDTDGDGLSDAQERKFLTDPARVDTDDDGLGDTEERQIWGSKPTDRDTDADAQGDPRLWDGEEVDTLHTSPVRADTDGDKYSDYAETTESGAVYDPLIANTPRLELSMVTAPSITLDVIRTSDTTQNQSFTAALTLGTQDSHSATDTQSQRFTAEVSATVATEVGGGITGVNASVSGSVTASAGYGYEKTASYTSESMQSATQTAEKTLAASTAEGRTLSGGTLSVGFTVTNTGFVSFRLSELNITALRRDPSNPTVFRVIGSMRTSLNAATLSSGQATGTLVASLDLKDADLALSLMRNPKDLLFEFSSYKLTDRDGGDYGFLEETTNASTALVVIDYGNGDIVRERVATNTQRRGGTVGGVKLSTVLRDVLKLPYSTSITPSGVQVLTALQDNGPAGKGGAVASNRADHSLWATVGSGTLGITSSTAFDDIILKSNSEIRLLYVQDQDQDGLLSSEEALYGTSDLMPDTDGDGVSDHAETKVGWTVTPRSPVTGYPRRVYASPTARDTDLDGLNDGRENALGTDPQNRDTDGDRLLDGTDPDPLTITNALPTVKIVTSSVLTNAVSLEASAADQEGQLARLNVDWGEGSPEEFSVSGAAASRRVNHLYQGNFTRNVRVKVTAVDAQGQESAPAFATFVVPAPPR